MIDEKEIEEFEQNLRKRRGLVWIEERNFDDAPLSLIADAFSWLRLVPYESHHDYCRGRFVYTGVSPHFSMIVEEGRELPHYRLILLIKEGKWEYQLHEDVFYPDNDTLITRGWSKKNEEPAQDLEELPEYESIGADPLRDGEVNVYTAGTTEPRDTFSDNDAALNRAIRKTHD